MILAALLALSSPARAGLLEECGQQLPIAGSAGFENAQNGRRTNRNTYSAAAFAERALTDGTKNGVLALQWSATFNAARVPTVCGDTTIFGGKSEHVYEEPLDLYASNLLFAFEGHGVGAFYSASVTQSIMGMRAIAVPALLIQLYPEVAAPAIGVWQRGDGVSSYSLDWIGGAHVDTRWVGARVGYSGIGGLYGSVDERTIGIFGTIDLPIKDALAGHEINPWSFLRTGLDRLDPKALGAEKVGKIIGMTSIFFRDLPFGEEAESAGDNDTDTTTTVDLMPALGNTLRTVADKRLRTLHFQQQSIGGLVDVDVSYAISPKPQIYNGLVAIHTPGYVLGHKDKLDHELTPGGMVKLGVVRLPPQYALGLEGGTYFSARAEARFNQYAYLQILFNDPEQLALYPFATNALSAQFTILWTPQ